MNITCHPLKDPSLWILVVALNVESSIELQHKLFVLMFLVSHKGQKTNVPKAVKGFLKAWQPSHSITIQTLMRKNSVLVV